MSANLRKMAGPFRVEPDCTRPKKSSWSFLLDDRDRLLLLHRLENVMARDPNDVDTPPSVATNCYDANDITCPRPSAPPFELVEDGHFDEAYAISQSRLQWQLQESHNRNPVGANPPPPSCGGDRGGEVERGEMGDMAGVGSGTVGEVEGLDRCRGRGSSMNDSSGWELAPPLSIATATSAVHGPREESSASASAVLTDPFVRATILANNEWNDDGRIPVARAVIIGNVPVCEVVTTPSSSHAQVQAQYNTEEGAAGDRGSGTNDTLPVGRLSCKIGLILLLVAAPFVITTAVVMMVRFNRDDHVPIIIVNDNGNRDDPTPIIDNDNDTAVVSSSWKQQSATIVGDDSYDRVGNSVALSADARIMVIGASSHDTYNGQVKVYRTDYDGGNWVQLVTINGGSDFPDSFGNSVDITPDGMTIICGSPQYFSSYDRPTTGYVRVFTMEGDSDLGMEDWRQIGQDIIGEANDDNFGRSVSISEDGETIAVGAHSNDGVNGVDSGHVRIYRLVDNGMSWQKIGQDIDGEAADYWSGHSLSLSADGSIVAIGAPHKFTDDGSWPGQVTVYRINSDGSSWERLGQSMYGDNAGDIFGWSINLSPDGSTLAIGSPGYGYFDYCDDRPGYVRVFSLTSGDDIADADTWNLIGQDIVGDADGDEFGYSVSLSDDGKTLAVGAPYANGKNGDNSGQVRIYRIDDTKPNWIQIGADIDGDAADDGSGYSVSLSADGNKVAIGSPWNDDNGNDSGNVRVYLE